MDAPVSLVTLPASADGERVHITAFAALRFTAHERRVLVPLALTGFFETYDVALLTLAAPVLARGLGLTIGMFGFGVAIIRLASLASIPVLRLADRWGRRTLLFVSLGIFSVATGMTALATGLVVFVAFQMVARVFLATESTLASLVIAEEFRPYRRGAGLSVLGVVSGAGFGAVGLLMLLIPFTALGWRLFYLFALIPLGIVVYLRRNLRETRAFVAARDEHRLQSSFWPSVGALHRRTLIKAVALVSAFGFVQTAGFFYASDLAQNTYGWSGLFTVIVVTAGVFGIVGFLLGGPVSDRVGRKPIVALANVLAAAGTILIFTDQRALFVPGFFLDAAAGACFVTVTLAYVAELFPTELRATLSSVVIACQVAAGSLGLALLGVLSGVVSTSLVMLVLGGTLMGSLMMLRGLPETRGRDLIHSGPPKLEPDPAPGAVLLPETLVPA
jgi:putative MFS transporter